MKKYELKQDNIKLLSRLTDIQTRKNSSLSPVPSKKKFESLPDYATAKPVHSLNSVARKLEDERIAKENSKMIKRIYKRDSEYSKSAMERDFKAYQDAS